MCARVCVCLCVRVSVCACVCVSARVFTHPLSLQRAIILLGHRCLLMARAVLTFQFGTRVGEPAHRGPPAAPPLPARCDARLEPLRWAGRSSSAAGRDAGLRVQPAPGSGRDSLGVAAGFPVARGHGEAGSGPAGRLVLSASVLGSLVSARPQSKGRTFSSHWTLVTPDKKSCETKN